MGEIVKFYSKEEQEILRKIEDNIKIKMALYQELKSSRDYDILEAIKDVDLEIQELLLDIEAKKLVMTGSSKSVTRRLLVVRK